jgi:hypothetical protein
MMVKDDIDKIVKAIDEFPGLPCYSMSCSKCPLSAAVDDDNDVCDMLTRINHVLRRGKRDDG